MSATAPTAVYALCLLTSIVCAGLLLRAYLRERTPLLLWTAVSFLLLAVNNLLLVTDMVLLPSVDLWVLRQAAAALALAVLLYGFIFEVRS